MSTTINDQQVNRMLIQSIQNGAAPIDYTALNFQEMAKQSSASMNIGGGDVEMMNNNGSGMMVGLISETKLPKRGISIADGASDVEMTMETSTLNSNTILSSPYKEIDVIQTY